MKVDTEMERLLDEIPMLHHGDLLGRRDAAGDDGGGGGGGGFDVSCLIRELAEMGVVEGDDDDGMLSSPPGFFGGGGGGGGLSPTSSLCFVGQDAGFTAPSRPFSLERRRVDAPPPTPPSSLFDPFAGFCLFDATAAAGATPTAGTSGARRPAPPPPQAAGEGRSKAAGGRAGAAPAAAAARRRRADEEVRRGGVGGGGEVREPRRAARVHVPHRQGPARVPVPAAAARRRQARGRLHLRRRRAPRRRADGESVRQLPHAEAARRLRRRAADGHRPHPHQGPLRPRQDLPQCPRVLTIPNN